jgi:hypothetical protein
MPFGLSITATGNTAAAPGAGTAIASTAIAVGTYKVRGWYTITGAAETAAHNVRLTLLTEGSIADFPSNMGVNGVGWFVIDDVQVNQADTLRLQVGPAAGAASTVYTGTIVATRQR